MNRRLLALNLILVALLAWGGTQLRRRWIEARQHESEILAKAAPPLQVVPPPPLAPVAPAPATEYNDVAQRTLFSADRNPNIEIVVEEPKPAPPEPPIPAMPVYYGQMAFAKPVVLLSAAGVKQKGFGVGDQIGDFKILAFDRQNITLGWNGKELVRELKSLAPTEAPAERASAAKSKTGSSVAATSAKAGKAAPVKDVMQTTLYVTPTSPPPQTTQNNPNSNNSNNSNNSTNSSVLGPQIGKNRGCVPGDDSPNGTVKDGYKKAVVVSLMGSCQWEPTQ